eukprot:3488682-Rhodomonas_salina.3
MGGTERRLERDVLVCERAENLALASLLELARREVRGQQVARRPCRVQMAPHHPPASPLQNNDRNRTRQQQTITPSAEMKKK